MGREHQRTFFAIIAAVVIIIVLIMPDHSGITAAGKNHKPQDKIDLKLMEKGLVNLADTEAEFVIDLKYASRDNFTGSPLYHSARCYLRKSTAEKLIAANREFRKKGYRIKIFDAYRPLSVQWVLWAKVPGQYKAYIADPHTGSRHNRGIAVDMTLVASTGQEIEMPTGFDQFGPQCHSDYAGCSPTARKNRRMLADVMERHGFKQLDDEWWHFDDAANLNAPLLDEAF